MPSKTVAELANACGGAIEGDRALAISGANSLEEAGADQLSFVSGAKLHAAALRSQAGCLIVDQDFTSSGHRSLIRAPRPRVAFASALKLLYPNPSWLPHISPAASISPSARLAADCFIGAYTTVGDDSEIGSGCYLAEGVHVGNRVSLGEGCVLHPGVTIYDGVTVGARVILHAGCVLGADGFGFTPTSTGYEKFPQVGSVSIGNDVEIGANSCVDRASLGMTRIGAGTKLDNLVHVAHNCTVGEHVVIAAQTGLAGGVVIGDGAVLGGQVGAADKAQIAARAVVGAKSGIVSRQRVPAGEPVWGIPARPIRQHLKGLANVGKIEDLKQAVRLLERRLEILERGDS